MRFIHYSSSLLFGIVYPRFIMSILFQGLSVDFLYISGFVAQPGHVCKDS